MPLHLFPIYLNKCRSRWSSIIRSHSRNNNQINLIFICSTSSIYSLCCSKCQIGCSFIFIHNSSFLDTSSNCYHSSLYHNFCQIITFVVSFQVHKILFLKFNFLISPQIYFLFFTLLYFLVSLIYSNSLNIKLLKIIQIQYYLVNSNNF